MDITTLDDHSSILTYEGSCRTGGIPHEEFAGTTTFTDVAGTTSFGRFPTEYMKAHKLVYSARSGVSAVVFRQTRLIALTMDH